MTLRGKRTSAPPDGGGGTRRVYPSNQRGNERERERERERGIKKQSPSPSKEHLTKEDPKVDVPLYSDLRGSL